MGKIKIQGSDNGTATFSVVSPDNTSTDRTITLPDATGTLLTADGDGSSLTGVGVDGISSSADATAMTIDSSENVGFGVVPKTWHSGYKGFQIDALSLMAHKTTPTVHTMGNAYHNGSNYKYVITGVATQHSMEGGDHVFRTAASGSADANITWTDQLSLKADGRGLSQFTAKAWANLNGTGTIALRDSHNISSVTDNGTGDYSFNFTNNLANANYSVTNSFSRDGWDNFVSIYPGHQSVSATRVTMNDTSATAGVDTDGLFIQVFGD
jgi:hypothetical protein